MDRVVAPQPKLLPERAGLAGERAVNPEQQNLALNDLEVLESLGVVTGREPVGAISGRERRAALGIGEDARRCRMPRSPELGGELGAVLGDDELDEGRGVEIEVQRRCWPTRSETEPRALIRGRFGRRAVTGAVTSPRRTRSSRESSAFTDESRAIGLPRRVTTTSDPFATRSRYSLSRSCSSRTPT